jgi:hypothetical protein
MRPFFTIHLIIAQVDIGRHMMQVRNNVNKGERIEREGRGTTVQSCDVVALNPLNRA